MLKTRDSRGKSKAKISQKMGRGNRLKANRQGQFELLKKTELAYGGDLLRTRKGRAHGRPLDTKNTMHLVLRSSKAKGEWSFLRRQNKSKIKRILERFSNKYGIRILSWANVGNHLHIHIKLANRHTYRPFIRSITGAIAMAVTGASRWQPLKSSHGRFWDYRPFTRIVVSFKAVLNMRDYIRINQLESMGYFRDQAEYLIRRSRFSLANGVFAANSS